MKHSIHILTAAILVGSGLILSAQVPQNPPLSTQRNPFLRDRGAPGTPPRAAEGLMPVTGIVETFTLKGADAVTFLSSAPDGEVRYRQVQEWLGTGRARLESVAACGSRSNTRTLVESVDMVQVGRVFQTSSNAEDAPVATSLIQQSFGDRLEFQPLVSADGATFNLNVSLEISQLLGHRSLRANPRTQPLPSTNVEKRQLMTSLVGRTGKPLLLGTLSRPVIEGEGKEKELVVAFGRVLINRDAPPAPVAPTQSLEHTEHLFSFYSMDRAAAREILAGDQKPGAMFGAVQALVEKQQARFEHGQLVASQAGVRAKSDENVVSAEPGGAVVGGGKEQPADPKAIPPLVGKNRGLSIEVETVMGAPGGETPKGASVADVNAIIYWRDDRGLWKTQAGGPTLFPETNVQESRKIETTLVCHPGVQTFVGTLNPPRQTGVNDRADSGKIWLAFLRVNPVNP